MQTATAMLLPTEALDHAALTDGRKLATASVTVDTRVRRTSRAIYIVDTFLGKSRAKVRALQARM